MSLAPSGVMTVNARSHGQATAGSCFATLVRTKKQVHSASLGRRLPDTLDLAEGFILPQNTQYEPIAGLIASSVGKGEGRLGLRPSVVLHIGGAKTCPRQLVSTHVLPGHPVILKVEKNKKRGREDETLSASVADKSGNADKHIVFASCISGGAADNSIDVVLGGSYNACVRDHTEYYKKYFNNK